MTPDFTCVCGKILPHQETQHDFKCAHCGRVYNYQGRYLWREHPGNDLPGSTDFDESEGDVGKRAEDKVPDPEARQTALEKGFEDAKLPEEPRRRTDEELKADAAEQAAIDVLTADRESRRKARGHK